jgi:hypothetical protein
MSLLPYTLAAVANPCLPVRVCTSPHVQKVDLKQVQTHAYQCLQTELAQHKHKKNKGQTQQACKHNSMDLSADASE